MKKKILEAIKKTSNTQQKKKVFPYLPRLVNELCKKLEEKEYTPSKFSCFVVKDPKVREIFAPEYVDRVVHHLIIAEIEEEIDGWFIYDSCANRKNKGVHFGILRLQKFLRSEKTEYVLQADVKSFFPSIDKRILWKILKKNVLNMKSIEKEKSFLF